MALKAILALLLIHILSVASNEYSSSQESSGSDDKHRTKLDSSFKSGFAIGFAFFSVSIVTIFLSYCVPWTRLNKRKRNKVMMMTPMMTSLMERQEKKRQEANIKISKFEKLIPRISFTKLNNATGSFDKDNVIGVGKVGTVYKAAHPYHCFIAVKRFNDCQHLQKQFMSELIILGKFRHMNIVPLLGFCMESKERLLVYKYMPNRNLYDWLHPVTGEAGILDWHVRVHIAIGVARGLAWLHNYTKFLHLNITSRCILLDKDFEPKISNFGGAMHMSSNSKDFVADSEMRELDLIKKDVYQFGILLLELIAGKDTDSNSKSSHTLEETLIERITYLSSSSSSLFQAVDKSLRGQGFDGEFYRVLEETEQNHGLSTVFRSLYSAVDKSVLGQGFDCQVLNFLKVASTCIQPIPDRRPTMVQVYKMLMAVRKIYARNRDPEILGQTDPVSSDSSDDCFEITEVKS